MASTTAGTGHGNVWRNVLTRLGSMDGVRVTPHGQADVWLSSGHEDPPDGRPLVVHVHEIGWHDPQLAEFLDPAFRDRIEVTTRTSVAAAARVITPSEASRRQVIDAYGRPPEEVHAVPHGVDHELFAPGIPGGRQRVGAPYVLFVGVLHRRKNVAGVRAALSGLARAGLPHVLAMVANPPGIETSPSDLERADDIPGFPGRVRRFGGVTDRELATLMAGTDAFCLPSFFEGFGLPALEAMACGAPVVVSDRGALPEVVGDAGLVVAPDPSSVEAALRRVLTDPETARRLARAGVERAAQFSWERTATGWLEVLKAVA